MKSNKNYSFIIGILLGFLLSVPICVFAVTYFNASEISYSNSTSGMSATTVEEALDALYAKATIFNQADAQQGNVLSGKKFVGSGGTLLTGTMANKGAVNESVGVGGTYTIPAGYHNGSGKVTGPTLSGNAGVSHVLSGKTFYSNNGTIKTGTMANNGALGGTISPGGSYTIPAGYTSGGTVTASVISSDYAMIKGMGSTSGQTSDVLNCNTIAYAGAVGGTTAYTYTIRVQGSNDNSSWTTIDTSTTTDASRNGAISGTASGYSYYRIQVPSGSSSTMHWGGMIVKTS